ncbi:PorV/PorQ family protein [candidate division WOR-3 bacterium]|nr:PorV/PorQ family protein [candidate division WOR-3 bacterium]
MKFKGILAFIILIFIFQSLLFAGITDWYEKTFEKEESGIGMAFLKLPISAKQIAMGGVSTSVFEGEGGIYGNPATLLTKDPEKKIVFTHQNLFQGIHNEFAGILIPGKKMAMAFSTSGLFIDGIEYRTGPGESEGDFSAYDFSASMSAAYNLYRDMSVGVRTKIIHERIFESTTTVYAFDFGVFYFPFERLKFGATIENLGPKYSLKKDSETLSRLPTSWRVGLSADMPSFWNLREIIAVDAWKSPDVRMRFDVGAQITHPSRFSLRLGGKFNYDSQSFTAGFGYVWKSISLDYAFAPYSSDLGQAHVVTLTLSI